MEYTLYIGSKKAKHDIKYTFSKQACAILSRSNEDVLWTKHQKYSRRHTRCDKTHLLSKLYQRIKSTQDLFNKVQQMNRAKLLSMKDEMRTQMLKDLSHLRK